MSDKMLAAELMGELEKTLKILKKNRLSGGQI